MTDADVRQRAISALGEIGDTRAATAIAAALKDPSPSIRARAANALGELSDPTAVDALIAAARDANADVRRKRDQRARRDCATPARSPR